MPVFARADYADSTKDLTSYMAFARKLRLGQVVSLPLEEGETSRQVMRYMNQVAAKNELRLARLPSDAGTVRFKVMPVERRKINIPPEAIKQRTEKARATRAAHSRSRSKVAA